MSDPTEDSIEALLPFYVNGSLSEEERERVDAALAERPDLQAEVEALRAIRETMQAEPVQSPGEFGLARLKRDIRRESAATPSAQPRQRVWIWQAAAAIALALFAGQMVWNMTTSEPGVELAGVGQVADISIGFAPDATEADIRALLLDLDLEIVGGPSALGLYQLRVLEGADTATLIERLQSATDVVEVLDWEGE